MLFPQPARWLLASPFVVPLIRNEFAQVFILIKLLFAASLLSFEVNFRQQSKGSGMLVSYGKIWYLYLLIPSICSMIACSLLILSVLKQPQVRDRAYHRLSVALAVGQIIMFSSWLMGNK